MSAPERVAWLVAPWSWPHAGGIVAATTRARARSLAWMSAQDAGYPYRFTDFRALRLPELDEWARTDPQAGGGNWTPAAIPGGEEAARAARGRALERDLAAAS